MTNRTLCRDDFLTRIDHIAKKGVADAILLREKDLTEREYLELAEKVIRLTNSKSKLIFKPLPHDDPKQRQPDITLAKEKLGWEPTIELEEGLQYIIEYFKEYRS